jgi:hypothetical protein
MFEVLAPSLTFSAVTSVVHHGLNNALNPPPALFALSSEMDGFMGGLNIVQAAASR